MAGGATKAQGTGTRFACPLLGRDGMHRRKGPPASGVAEVLEAPKHPQKPKTAPGLQEKEGGERRGQRKGLKQKKAALLGLTDD